MRDAFLRHFDLSRDQKHLCSQSEKESMSEVRSQKLEEITVVNIGKKLYESTK
jgi:hypothetical protein